MEAAARRGLLLSAPALAARSAHRLQPARDRRRARTPSILKHPHHVVRRTGTKQEFPTGAIPAGQLALGDVNRDGARDVVLVMPSVFGPTLVLTGNLVAVMLNDGQRKLGAPIPVPTQLHPGDLAVEDLDGDGRVDLAVVNKASEELGVLRACSR